MNRRGWWIVVGCWLWVVLGLLGERRELRAEEPFAEGNRFFREGKFNEAEKAYEREMALRGDSAAVRHNLGRVREALGDPGGAMLEWERALRIDAIHRPSLEALELARRSVGGSGPRQSWWWVTPSFLRGREAWLIAVGIWGAVGAGLGAWFFGWRAAALGLGILSLGMAGCGFFCWKASGWAQEEAVIRERVVTARKAPADPAPSLGDYPAGTIVRVVGTSASWTHCRLPEGSFGWIPSSAVEKISSGP